MRWLVALLPLATACADDRVVEVGVVEYYGDASDVLDAPTTARAGEPIQLRVMTFGGGCIETVYLDVDVDVEDATVELTPYDSHPVDAVCTDDLRYLMHETEVTLESAGAWTVRVHGRRVGSGPETLVEKTYPLVVD